MGQSAPLQWWEVIVGILSLPTSFLAMIYMYLQIKKTQLEIQKTKLENLEKEKKLNRGKKKPSNISIKSSSKSKSALHKILLDIESVENKVNNLILEILRPLNFSQKNGTTGINSQRTLGSIIEFFLFLSFVIADASLIVQNLAIFFPSTTIPSFLTNTTTPLLVSTVGTSLALGLMIADLLELTNLTSWVNLRSKKKPFLAVMLLTLVFSIVLSVLIALTRYDLLTVKSSGILIASSLAQNLITIPLFVTTALLFDSLQGMIVIIALFVVLLRLPITIIRKIIAKIIYYVID